MSKTLQELQDRQAAALEANAERKQAVIDLKAKNATLEAKIAELEGNGGLTHEGATALKAELALSNDLLEKLQDAVLSEPEPEAPTEPEATSDPSGVPAPTT